MSRQRTLSSEFETKNGQLFTVFLSDSPEGYLGVAAQVVKGFAQIGTDEFGDGYGAVKAFEAKCLLDGDLIIEWPHQKITFLRE